MSFLRLVDLFLICVALPPPLFFPRLLISTSRPFVFVLSSEITYELLPSMRVFLSLSISLLLAVHPASHRNVSRGTPGETNWIKQVQSSAGAWVSLALSELLSLLLLSHSSVSCSMFSFCPPAPSGLPFFLLVVPANPFAFCCSFSPLLPPLLLFSRLSAQFLWHERDTKRSFECLCM